MGGLIPFLTLGSTLLSSTLASRSSAPKVISSPTAPAPPQASAPPPVSAPQENNAETTDTNESSNEESVAAEREENLLRRSRGRTGTIQTSFRGLLNQADQSGKRKTLLGE